VTAALAQQAKAIIGLALAVLTALAVSLPSAQWIQVVIGVLGAVITYIGVYATPNADPPGKHEAD
jgi:hypothetical protein